MVEIIEFNSYKQLEEIKTDWNDMLKNSINNHIYLTWEWLSCWWKHFGKGREMRVLCLKDESDFIAIAPLMCSKYKIPLFGNVVKIEFIGSPESDYNSLILKNRNSEYLELFLDYLVSNYSDWNILELRDIPEEFISSDLKHKIFNEFMKYPLKYKVIDICPYLILPNSFDDYKKMMGRKRVKNIERRERRLQELGKLEIKTHENFDSLEKAMNVFYKLHQKRWVQKGEEGVFAKKKFRIFHLDLAKRFEKNGWLDLNFLTLNEKPIATMYSFDYYNKKYLYLSGFDPEYSKFSPGNLLEISTIEKSFENGLEEIDYLRGHHLYKYNWCTNERKNIELKFLNKGLVSKLLIWAENNDAAILLAKKLGLKLTR